MKNKLSSPQSFLIFAMLNIFTVPGCFFQTSPSLIPNIFPAAPNTASLHKFENYSVNLYSGIPDISIPLYEIKMGDVTVPITLKYHASGIKVTERAGWAGLGWALTTGGEINRRIMGGADEGSNGYLKGNLRQSGDIDLIYPEAPDLYYVASVANGNRDAEPDIFSYRFPGKSGKFFFDGTDNFEPRLLPYSPVKIEPETPTINSLSFRIKDEKGFTYVFGEQITENTRTSNNGGIMNSTSAWKLEKIYSPHIMDSIHYDYFPSNIINYDENIYITSVSDNVSIFWLGAGGYSYIPPWLTIKATFSSIAERKPKEILFKNGKIVFELSSSNREDLDSKSLKRIKVLSKNDNEGWVLLKEVEFEYSYFGTGTSTKRLRLDAVHIKNNKSQDVEIYNFLYNNLALPEYTSTSQDYWGYYNGKANNTLVPRRQINVQTGSNATGSGTDIWIGSNIPDSREPDEAYMKAGVLERMIYPTGGYTDFEFETNRYSTSDGEIKLAGGLRVKSIKSYSGQNDTNPISRFYEYNSARPNFHLAHYVFSTSQTYEYYALANGGPGKAASKRVRNYFSNPTIDIVPYDGIPVSYPKVTEYLKNGDIYNGKIEYEFRDQSDAQSHSAVSAATGKPSYISKFYARGQISKEKVFSYNSETNTFTPIKENLYKYSAFPQTSYHGVGLKVAERIVYEGASKAYGTGARDERYFYGNYSIESDDNYLVSKTETWFDNPSSPISTTTNYHYDNIVHQQISRTETIDSKGGINITEFHYPDDIVNNTQLGYDALTASERNVIEQMKWDGDHLTGVPIQTEKIKKGENGNTLSESARRTIFKSNNGLVLKEKIQISKNGGTLEDRVLFHNYDNHGNPIEISEIDGPSSIYLWGYNDQYPIAKIENANYLQIADALNPSSGDLSNIDESDLSEINGLRNRLPQIKITTYTYEPLVGVRSITDPKGRTTTYHYDAFNRLEFAKDEEGNILKEHKYHYKKIKP